MTPQKKPALKNILTKSSMKRVKGGSGKVQIKDIQITKQVDKASP